MISIEPLENFYKVLYEYKLLYLTFINTPCLLFFFRRIHSWFSGFRKWRQWWSRVENPRQFNQTGLRRRIPKWHWRDQTFGSGFWRSWFQMMLNLDMFFAADDGKRTLTSSLPFLALLFCKISCQTKWLFFFKQTNKKPIPIPPFKKFMMNSWEKHDEKKSIKYKKIIDYWTTRHPSYVLKYDYIISSYYNFNQFNVFFPVRGWCIFFPFIKMIEFQFLKIGTYTIIT